jgi:hypothetical protein
MGLHTPVGIRCRGGVSTQISGENGGMSWRGCQMTLIVQHMVQLDLLLLEVQDPKVSAYSGFY